ncbi:NHLRC3 [Cervus elaphus hippelaphus]|uniref:NHLRC3 n=1 Tax=Cervus elaphus hippelaphus TaxID=46360 RepID=A0A212C4C1_CEREH|nr:NHLRC3 [Cervus elaphus hippelaphus]
MTRFWVCIAGAGFFLALLVLHSRFCASREILYRLDVDWPKYSEYFTGATFCVGVDSLNGLVYVAQRGDNIPKVLVFTEDGYFLRAWNYTVDTPHGIFAASTPQEKSVWITDVGSDFMILWLHGENGTGPAKFNIPHSVTVDSTGRVWVADRGNKRLQVFDKDTGDWLGEWNNCFSEEGPSAVRCILSYSRQKAEDYGPSSPLYKGCVWGHGSRSCTNNVILELNQKMELCPELKSNIKMSQTQKQ